jgi:hypothetical protein
MNETQQKNLADQVVGMVREGKWKTLNNGRDRSVYKWLCDNLAKREHNLARNQVQQELGDNVPLDVKVAMKRISSKQMAIVKRDNDFGLVRAVHSDSAEVIFASEFDKGNYRPELVALEHLEHVGNEVFEFDVGDLALDRKAGREYQVVAIGVNKFAESVVALKDTTTGSFAGVNAASLFKLKDNQVADGKRVIHVGYGFTGTVNHSANGISKVEIDSDQSPRVENISNNYLRQISDGTRVTFESVFDKFKSVGDPDLKLLDAHKNLSNIMSYETYKIPFGTILEIIGSVNFYKKYVRYLYSKSGTDDGFDIVVQSLKGEVLQIISTSAEIVTGDNLAYIQPLFDKIPLPEGFDTKRESNFNVGQAVVVKESQNIAAKYRGATCVVDSINGDGTVTLFDAKTYNMFTLPESAIKANEESSGLVGMNVILKHDNQSTSEMYRVISYHRGNVYKLKAEVDGRETWESGSGLIAITPNMQAEIDAQKTYKIGDVYYYSGLSESTYYGKKNDYDLVRVVGYAYKIDGLNITATPTLVKLEDGNDAQQIIAKPDSSLIDASFLNQAEHVFIREDDETGKVIDVNDLDQSGGEINVFDAVGKKLGKTKGLEPLIGPIFDSIGGETALRGKLIGDVKIITTGGSLHSATNNYISKVALHDESNSVEISLSNLSTGEQSKPLSIGPAALIALSSAIAPMSDFMSGKKIDIPNVAEQFDFGKKGAQLKFDNKGNIPFVQLLTDVIKLSATDKSTLNRSLINNIDQASEMIDGWLLMAATRGTANGGVLAAASEAGVVDKVKLSNIDKQTDAFASIATELPSYILEQVFQRSKYKARLFAQLFSKTAGFASHSFDQFKANSRLYANVKVALESMANTPELYNAAMIKGGVVKAENGKVSYNPHLTGRIGEDGKYKFTDFRRMSSAIVLGALATEDMHGVDLLASVIPSRASKREKILGFLNYLKGNNINDDGTTMLDADGKTIKREDAAINQIDARSLYDDRDMLKHIDRAIKVVSTVYGENESLLKQIDASVKDKAASKWLKISIANFAELSSAKLGPPSQSVLESLNSELVDGKSLVKIVANISASSEYRAWQIIVGKGSNIDAKSLVTMLEKGIITKQQADYLNKNSADDLQREVVNSILFKNGKSADATKIIEMIEQDIQAPKWAAEVMPSSIKAYLLGDRQILDMIPDNVILQMYDKGMFADVEDIDVFEQPTLKKIFQKMSGELMDKAVANGSMEDIAKIIDTAKSKALQDLLRTFMQRQFKSDEFINRIINSPNTIEEAKDILEASGKTILSPLNLYPDFKYKKEGSIIAEIHQVLDEHGKAYKRIAVPMPDAAIENYTNQLNDRIVSLQLNKNPREFVEARLFANQTNNVIGASLKQVMSDVVSKQNDDKTKHVLNALYMIATGDAIGDEIGTKIVREINSSINLKGFVSGEQIQQLYDLLGLDLARRPAGRPFEDMSPRDFFTMMFDFHANLNDMSASLASKENWKSISEAVAAAMMNQSVNEASKSLMMPKFDSNKKPLRSETGEVINEFKPVMTLKDMAKSLNLNDEQRDLLKQAIDKEAPPNPQLKEKQIFEDQWKRLISSPDSMQNVLLKVIGKLPEDYTDELSKIKKMLSKKDRSMADALITLCASISQSNFDVDYGSMWPINIKVGNQCGFSGEFEIECLLDKKALAAISESLPVTKDEKNIILEAAEILNPHLDKDVDKYCPHGLRPWIRCEVLNVLSKERDNEGRLVKGNEKVLAVREIQSDPQQRYSKAISMSMPEAGDIINIWKPENVRKWRNLKDKYHANGANSISPEEYEYIHGAPGEEVQVVVRRGSKAGTLSYDWNGEEITINGFAGKAEKFEEYAYKDLDEHMFSSRKPNEHEEKVIGYMTNFINVMYKTLIQSAMLMGTDKIYINPSWTMSTKTSFWHNPKNAPHVDTALRDIYDLAQQDFVVKKSKKDGMEIKEPALDQYGNEQWSSKKSSKAMKASYDNTAKRWGFTLVNLDHHHKTDKNWGYPQEIFVRQVWMLDLTGKNKNSQKMLKHLNKRMAHKKMFAQTSVAGASLAAFIDAYFKVMYRNQEFRFNRSGEVVAEAYQAWKDQPDSHQWVSNAREMAMAKQVASNKLGIDITGIDDPAWKYREVPVDFYDRMVMESGDARETDDRPEPSVIASQLDKILQTTMPNMWLHPEYRSLPRDEIPIRVAKDILQNAIEVFPQKALRDDSEYLNAVLRAVTAFDVSPEKELELLTRDTEESEESVFADDSSPAMALASEAAQYLSDELYDDSEETFAMWIDAHAPELHSNDELRNEVVKILKEQGFKLDPNLKSPAIEDMTTPSSDELDDMFRTERKVDSSPSVGDSVCVDKTVSADIRASSLACKKASGKIVASFADGYVLKFDNEYDERVLNRQRWLFSANDLKGKHNVR